MHTACKKGDLPFCQWLFDVSAADDTHKVDNVVSTPMYAACTNGQLSVCQWLFDVGAAKDIHKPSSDGWTPMFTGGSFFDP